MKDIRIGNDIIVSWSIFAEGAPYSLEGKEVTLYLCSQFGKRRAEGYAITGNQITWTFFGKEQKHIGKYSLELVVNEDAEGMVTTDACDFVNLVSCSCKVGGADEQGVQTESIELTSSFEFVPYDDTELRKMIEGKQDTLESGKTIKTINGQSILGEGNLEIEGGGESYDDTEIRAELDELSTEIEQVSENKQDKISDLDSIRSGASKGKTSEQTSNKTTTISESSTDTQYPSAKAVYNALQNVGGGGGGTDTELREAIFGKVTSKEFAINGYHASTADTFAVDIKQGEVFHLKLETLGAEITKYQLYVKYEGDAEQTSLLYFAPNEDYSFFAERPIVEFGVNTSSGWVTTKGNAKFSITQGGMTQPYNYMQLGVITIAENISELNVLDYIPLLLKFKNVKVYCHFTYSAERTKSGAIKLNKENSCSISLDGLFGSATSTAYILDITLDKNSIKAYIECHSNSFGNPQLSDGNQGKNFGKLALGNPIDTFIINLPLLAGDKLTFYGK